MKRPNYRIMTQSDIRKLSIQECKSGIVSCTAAKSVASKYKDMRTLTAMLLQIEMFQDRIKYLREAENKPTSNFRTMPVEQIWKLGIDNCERGIASCKVAKSVAKKYNDTERMDAMDTQIGLFTIQIDLLQENWDN